MTETGRNQAPVQPSGIFVVDKPGGLSSAGLVAAVKKILGVRKIGHAGTLDPLATGVMVCCVNQATRLARFFLGGDKRYEAMLCLGVETDTQDATGSVTTTCEVPDISKGKIADVLTQFSGDIEQMPPIYSALKQGGVRLYRLARQGRPVQKPPRRVHISSIRLLGVALPEVRFEVTCSAGTYVRTLCADIGSRLGCGGHLKSLRRTMACGFHIDRAITVDELKALAGSGKGFDPMVPMAEALTGVPEVVVGPDMAAEIQYGRPIEKQMLDFNGGSRKKYIKVVDRDRRLLAVLSASDGKNTYDYECVFA